MRAPSPSSRSTATRGPRSSGTPEHREGCRLEAHRLVPGWTTTGDREHPPGAWLPEQVADYLLGAIERREFYVICPDEETTCEMDRKRILWSAMDLIERRPPLSRWRPDYQRAFEP